MASPRVTLWIPSYNYGRYLADAVDSVLEQDFEDFELIIFDDGSTDESYAIAESYAERDRRIRVLSHPGRANRGVTPTMNAAFGASRGEYVGVLPADDTLLPASLTRRVAHLDSDPRLTFVYGLIEMLDATAQSTGKIVGTAPDLLQDIDATSDRFAALLLHNYIPGHAVLVRREAFERVGGFDDRLLYSDWELSIKLLAQGPAGFVVYPPVAGHRDHGENMSIAATRDANDRRKLEVFRSIDDAASAIGGRLSEPRMRALVRLQRSWHAFVVNELEDAEASLVSAPEVDPSIADDPEWLLWWLGPRQSTGRAPWIVDALSTYGSTPSAVIAEGNAQGHYGCWFLVESERWLSETALTRLLWGVISNELELSRSRASLAIVAACLRYARKEPRSLHEPWFLKTVLCAAGAWPAVRKLRARTTGSGSAD